MAASTWNAMFTKRQKAAGFIARWSKMPASSVVLHRCRATNSAQIRQHECAHRVPGFGGQPPPHCAHSYLQDVSECVGSIAQAKDRVNYWTFFTSPNIWPRLLTLPTPAKPTNPHALWCSRKDAGNNFGTRLINMGRVFMRRRHYCKSTPS